jgi:hypothetical protein
MVRTGVLTAEVGEARLRGWRVGLGAACLALLAAALVGAVIPGRASTAGPLPLAASISKPVKVHGLVAAQDYTIENAGTVDAHKVRAEIRLAPGLVMRPLASPQGHCVAAGPVAECTLGTLLAGQTLTLHARFHLGYVAPAGDNAFRVTAANATPALAGGASYFVNRYWVCGCATAYTYPNGWSVPPTDQGVSVLGDDTVRLLDGYYIAPNGVLHFPDGRMIEETLTRQLFIPARHALSK